MKGIFSEKDLSGLLQCQDVVLVTSVLRTRDVLPSLGHTLQTKVRAWLERVTMMGRVGKPDRYLGRGKGVMRGRR